MNNKVLIGCLFLFLLSFSTVHPIYSQEAVSSSDQMAAGKIVKSIDVRGNKTISIATILAKIKTRVGQEYLEAVVSDDLKRLYNTGYFSNVQVDKEYVGDEVKVIISVLEKSIIEEVTFSKTKHFKKKVFLKHLKSQSGKFLDKKWLKDDVDKIKELYAKKGLTKVEVEVETFVDDVTNKASLHFVVREGYRVFIGKINVYGNDSFKDKKILRVMKTRKKWLFSKGVLKEDVLEEDMERIALFYENKGYIDARSEYSVEPSYEGKMIVDVYVTEGKRYFVGDVSLSGLKVASELEVKSAMENMYEGNIFSRQKLSEDIESIRTVYFDKGYIFANVKESTSLDPDTGRVEVSLNVDEGGLAYVERVDIQGNARTRDSVIRREVRLQPGDRFDGAKLRRSKERLKNLGYFEEVVFDI